MSLHENEKKKKKSPCTTNTHPPDILTRASIAALAKPTCVRLLAGVGLDVAIEMAALGKCSVAEITRKRALPRVLTHVNVKITSTQVNFTACITKERLFVLLWSLFFIGRIKVLRI